MTNTILALIEEYRKQTISARKTGEKEVKIKKQNIHIKKACRRDKNKHISNICEELEQHGSIHDKYLAHKV